MTTALVQRGKTVDNLVRTAGMHRRRGATAAAESIAGRRERLRTTPGRNRLSTGFPPPPVDGRGGLRPQERNPGRPADSRVPRPVDLGTARGHRRSRRSKWSSTMAGKRGCRLQARKRRERKSIRLNARFTLSDVSRSVPWGFASSRGPDCLRMRRGPLSCEEVRRSGRARACRRRAWEWCVDRGSWGWRR